jgi:hypothetical protein
LSSIMTWESCGFWLGHDMFFSLMKFGWCFKLVGLSRNCSFPILMKLDAFFSLAHSLAQFVFVILVLFFSIFLCS